MMFLRQIIVCFFLGYFARISDASCLTEKDPDFVQSLPGYDQPLPSAWFSGFLDYELNGRQVHTHYVFIEAEDDFDDSKPLIYWSNGGPGASSLFGILTELGNMLINQDSMKTEAYHQTGIPTPLYNPYAWTRLGHIVMIDQPAPVGFSSCNGETKSHSCGGLAWTDELASQNAHLALQTFYEKFSCLQNKPLYLTGESYGGIYIPTLARRVINESPEIPLQGFAVGDGCLGTETGICGEILNPDSVPFWNIMFLAGHGQMPLSTFREFMHSCRVSLDNPDAPLHRSPECEKALSKVQRQVGSYFEYALYDECIYEQDMTLLGGAVNDYPCGGAMQAWLNTPAVKQALHVQDEYFFSVDNAEGDFDYTPTEPDLRGFYQHVAQETNLRVLVSLVFVFTFSADG